MTWLPIKLVSDSFADEVGRHNEIFEDGFVDCGQSSAVGSLLGLVSLLPLGLNSSLGNKHAVGLQSGLKLRDKPLMDFLSELQARERDVDEVDVSALLALGGEVDFLDSGNVEISEVVFPFR